MKSKVIANGILDLDYNPLSNPLSINGPHVSLCMFVIACVLRPGGGGHSGTEGGRTLVTYFAEEGVFF